MFITDKVQLHSKQSSMNTTELNHLQQYFDTLGVMTHLEDKSYLPENHVDGDQAQMDMEANHQDQEEVEAQVEDAHGGQSPPQRLTRSMLKALGASGRLFSLFVISLYEGA